MLAYVALYVCGLRKVWAVYTQLYNNVCAFMVAHGDTNLLVPGK